MSAVEEPTLHVSRPSVPGGFLGRAKVLIAHAGTASGGATALATVVAILMRRMISRPLVIALFAAPLARRHPAPRFWRAS